MCGAHYARQQRHGDPLAGRAFVGASPCCIVPGCTRPFQAKGMCKVHYGRQQRHDDPLARRIGKGEAINFSHEVVLTCTDTDPKACLRWPYKFWGKSKYPKLRYDGTTQCVHRVACIIKHGPPPFPKAQACHNCNNPWCVNPHHLRWDTQIGNDRDGDKFGTRARGERNGNTKLSDDLIREIWSTEGSNREIGLQYGISRIQVSSIKRGVTRKHLGLGVARTGKRIVNPRSYATHLI
jgi:hypothetical protein